MRRLAILIFFIALCFTSAVDAYANHEKLFEYNYNYHLKKHDEEANLRSDFDPDVMENSCDEVEDVIVSLKEEINLYRRLIITAEKYKHRYQKESKNYLELVKSVHKYNHMILINDLEIHTLSQKCKLDTHKLDLANLCPALKSNFKVIKEERAEEIMILKLFQKEHVTSTKPENVSEEDWAKFATDYTDNSKYQIHLLNKEMEMIHTHYTNFCAEHTAID